ncbi:hypothetical protein ACFQY4_00355 [Catellatospora bangladeshensis]|uniref:Lipoprotein LpqB beta-propeller domain-containing protein n=1 Tax=Catellatospora bangladeshensis TaxID=310355 RepID=A0A8J3JNN9_9ACTN|nr:hypothetical protein [Catellatospora bangladeshensis]GIF81184.1 hypothetical protein Cba03nite_25330 [Catellatospora bangladeshensis]
MHTERLSRTLTRRGTIAVAGVSLLLALAACSGSSSGDEAAPSTAPQTQEQPKPTVPTAYYYAYDEKAMSTVVLRLENGKAEKLATIPSPTFGVPNSLTLAPNASLLAWVQAPDGGKGDLYVAEVAGSGKHKVTGGVYDVGWAVRWNADSRSVATSAGIVDVNTGRVTKGKLTAQSRGGEFRAYGDGKAVVVTDGTGKELRRVPFTTACKECEGGRPSVVSVSIDGRYVSIANSPTDASRADTAYTVLDTTTGKAVALPKFSGMLFQTDGSFVLRVGDAGSRKLVLVDAAGTVLAESAEPAELAGARLFAS